MFNYYMYYYKRYVCMYNYIIYIYTKYTKWKNIIKLFTNLGSINIHYNTILFFFFLLIIVINPVQFPLHEPYFDLTPIRVTHTKIA